MAGHGFRYCRLRPSVLAGVILRLQVRTVVTLLGLMLVATGVRAEVVQRGDLRVSFEGGLEPTVLPRKDHAPVAVTLAGRISMTDATIPPQLRTISLALNRNGRLDGRGLPVCKYHQIQPASTVEAMRSCRRSFVGGGTFRARVVLPEQSPFPSRGRILAFNGAIHGRPVLFAHIYGTTPLPQSQVLVFHLGRTSGRYRTTLRAELPEVAADWGYISSVSLTLNRQFRRRGQTRSFVSAACAAPDDFSIATFRLARATFDFDDGRTLTSALVRSCRVARP